MISSILPYLAVLWRVVQVDLRAVQAITGRGMGVAKSFDFLYHKGIFSTGGFYRWDDFCAGSGSFYFLRLPPR
jgi:hypothetical protein